MKSLKVFSVVGIAAVFLIVLSFKNAEPAVEYGIVNVGASNCRITINENVETIPYGKGVIADIALSKTLNDLSKKGWRVVGVAGSSAQDWHKIYIERNQP